MARSVCIVTPGGGEAVDISMATQAGKYKNAGCWYSGLDKNLFVLRMGSMIDKVTMVEMLTII